MESMSLEFAKVRYTARTPARCPSPPLPVLLSCKAHCQSHVTWPYEPKVAGFYLCCYFDGFRPNILPKGLPNSPGFWQSLCIVYQICENFSQPDELSFSFRAFYSAVDTETRRQHPENMKRGRARFQLPSPCNPPSPFSPRNSKTQNSLLT